MPDRPNWSARELPVLPDTVTVLGHRVTASCPMWRGLDWSDAILREQNTLALAFFGAKAPPDHHLDVAWCHPEDRPSGIRYRVRPRRKGWRFHKREDGAWVLRKERDHA